MESFPSSFPGPFCITKAERLGRLPLKDLGDWTITGLGGSQRKSMNSPGPCQYIYTHAHTHVYTSTPKNVCVHILVLAYIKYIASEWDNSQERMP